MNTETIINKQACWNNMKRTIMILTFLITLTFIGFTSAVGDIGIVKQNECIDLHNYCPTCSYINLTSIKYPNGTINDMNEGMTKSNNNYNYTFCDTLALGKYSYITCGDKSGIVACETITFESSPSGRSGSSNIALVIILIVVIYTVTLLFFFGRNLPLSVLCGMMMGFFGIWIVRNGIVIYRDNLTNYFGYVTMVIGLIIALWAAIEWGMEEVF